MRIISQRNERHGDEVISYKPNISNVSTFQLQNAVKIHQGSSRRANGNAKIQQNMLNTKIRFFVIKYVPPWANFAEYPFVLKNLKSPKKLNITLSQAFLEFQFIIFLGGPNQYNIDNF